MKVDTCTCPCTCGRPRRGAPTTISTRDIDEVARRLGAGRHTFRAAWDLYKQVADQEHGGREAFGHALSLDPRFRAVRTKAARMWEIAA